MNHLILGDINRGINKRRQKKKNTGNIMSCKGKVRKKQGRKEGGKGEKEGKRKGGRLAVRAAYTCIRIKLLHLKRQKCVIALRKIYYL